MKQETMTIHEAMAELKMLKKRIAEKQNETFVCTNKHSNKKIGGLEIADFVKKVDSTYQSLEDMLARYAAIKSKISLSNASTIVNINGKDYTVAEAIEIKRDSGINEMYLLDIVMEQYAYADREAKRVNAALEDKADKYVSDLFGTKEKVDGEEAMTVRTAYIEKGSLDIISGTDLINKVTKRREDLQKFMATVDAKLSISNATTFITIEY